MSNIKKDNNQHVVPVEWRKNISEIVDIIRFEEFDKLQFMDFVESVSPDDEQRIKENVEDYGEILAPLLDDSWSSSVCQWMEGYWELVIDLCTDTEGVSDLSLFLRAYEKEASVIFSIIDVHVQ